MEWDVITHLCPIFIIGFNTDISVPLQCPMHPPRASNARPVLDVVMNFGWAQNIINAIYGITQDVLSFAPEAGIKGRDK